MSTVPTILDHDQSIRAFCLAQANAFVVSGQAGEQAGSATVTQVAEQYRQYVQDSHVA